MWRVILIAVLLSVVWGSPALAHDRYDCIARGEGTKDECYRHELSHNPSYNPQQHQPSKYALVRKDKRGRVSQVTLFVFPDRDSCDDAKDVVESSTRSWEGSYPWYYTCDAKW